MASKVWGFCDLSISKNFELDKLHIIQKLGFNSVAINTFVGEISEEPKKKKKKGDPQEKKDFIPPLLEIPKEILDNTKLNILQRVTVEFSDSSISHKLNQSENLKKYDIVAVVPKTFQAFQYACGTMDIDLISFDPESRIPFKINRKLYRQAVDRGVFFELMYAPAIKDSTARKNIISNAHIYHAIGKSKNIVLTSGAESYIHIRDVHDVISLGFLLGFDNTKSLEAIRNNGRKLILKGEGRRYGKHYMVVEKLCENNKTTDDYLNFYLITII